MGWGGQSGHMQAGIGWRNDGYDTNTPAINVYIDFYVKSVGWGYNNDNQVLSYGGSRAGSFGYSMSSPTGGTVEKYVGTAVIESQGQNYAGGPTYSASCSVSGAYDGSAPSHSESWALPARPPNTPLPPPMSVDSVGVNSARVVIPYLPDGRGGGVSSLEVYICSNNAYPGAGGSVVASWPGGTGTATGLNPVTTYYAFSRAGNGQGWSAWAGAIGFTTSGNPPLVVTGHSATSLTATGATINWTAPANGGSPITSYDIQVANDAAMTQGVQNYSVGNVLSMVYTGAGPGTKKYYRVRAVNGVGQGPYSSVLNFNTVQTVPTIVAPTEGLTRSDGAAVATILAPGLRTGRLVRAQFSKDNTFATGLIEATLAPAVPTGDENYQVINASAYLGSGTWYLRARIENSELGVNTAYTATRSFVQAHAPSTTTVSPTGGTYRVYQASVPFTFLAADNATNDSLTAYQIVVERTDTGTVVADTGKVASAFATGSKTISVAISASVKDIQLRWKVRVWDLADTVGSYSSYSIFYLVDLPAVTITAPGSTVNIGSPTVTWTFAATAGRTQSLATVTIKQNDTGATVWSESTTAPLVRTLTPTTTILQNNKTYTVTVAVRDSQGLENSTTSTFTSSYDPPAILSYTVSNPDIDNLGYVLVDWSNATADPSLVAWRVYRREVDSTSWELLAEFADQSVVTYKDFLVCAYKEYLYNVTQVANRFGENLESPVGLVVKSVISPVRRNIFQNPRPQGSGSSATGWGFSTGTDGVWLTQVMGSATDGPNGLAGYIRYTCTTAPTGGTIGPFARADGVFTPDRAAGTAWGGSVYVRMSIPMQFQLSLVGRDAGVNVGSTQIVPQGTVPAGTWTRLTGTHPGSNVSHDGLQVWAQLLSSVPIGTVIEVTQVIDDTLPYFDGAYSPDLLNFTPAWVSTAFNSQSTLTEVPYRAEDRILDIHLNTYWIVVPDVPDLSTALPGVTDEPSTLQFESATYTVIRRGRHRDYGDRLGYAGTLTVQVRGTAVQSVVRLKVEQMREAQETYWLRSPFGKLFPVALGDIGWTPKAGVGLAEMGELSIPYEEVGL